MVSPQALSEAERRVVAAWAADCAERVLPLFEAEAPDDDRARDGIERARAFARGELDAAGEIRRRFVAGRAAQAVSSPAARAAAWSAGQASGVAHMGAHALGAAAYAAKAADLTAASPHGAGAGAADGTAHGGAVRGTSEGGAARGATEGGAAEIAWHLQHLTLPVRTALARLPPLGEDRSGPLGAGLLATGTLGDAIRALQAGMR